MSPIKTIISLAFGAAALVGCGGGDKAAEQLVATPTSPVEESAPPATPTPRPTPEVGDPGEMAITRVVFGDRTGIGGTVDLRNVGDAPVDLGRFKLCQPPMCTPPLDIDVLPSGRILRITSSDTETIEEADGILVWEPGGAWFPPTSGNFGLYSVDGEGETIEIVSYVAWGEGGQPAEDIAVEGGVWSAGAFVDATDATVITAPNSGTTDPAEWEVRSGAE